MSAFRVALSADFRKSDGSPSFAEFDLSPLRDHPDIDLLAPGSRWPDLPGRMARQPHVQLAAGPQANETHPGPGN